MDNITMKHFVQGAKDFEDGVEFRLEAVSDKEYDAYMRGREYARTKVNNPIKAVQYDNVIRHEHTENVEAIDLWGDGE